MSPMRSPARFAIILGVFPYLIGAWPRAQAQAGITITLDKVAAERFPVVELDVAVLDQARRHQGGLSPGDFTIVEDSLPIGASSLQEVVRGTRQVFALNTLREMDLRDPFGISRFDRVRQALLEEWRTSSASIFGTDELVLLTPDGVLVDGSPSSAYLASVLNAFVPTYAPPASDYDLLAEALDFATQQGRSAKLSTHVIFVTTLPAVGGSEFPLSTLIAQARASSVSIHTVLVGSADAAASPRSEPLRTLARSTGGVFLLFEPPATLAPVVEAILSQRAIYRLNYESMIKTSGAHTVQLRLTGEGPETASEEVSFNVDLQAPQVAFIRPPREINRTRDTPSQSLKALNPTSQMLELLITFPDGHTRPVSRVQLWVDDKLGLERSVPPFDTLEWDVSNYTKSASHHLRAVITDILGLEGTSEEISIGIQVAAPTSGILALQPALIPLLVALGILLAGAAGSVMLVTGRTKAAAGPRARTPTPRPRVNPPLRASLAPRPPARDAEAYLAASGLPGAEFSPIPLTGVDHTLGRDPALATVVFDDPSVEGIHAKLIRLADGGYVIRDQGSISGTWVNYGLVPPSGQRLANGDLVHLGRVGIRFRLPASAPPREIRIRPLDEPANSYPNHSDVLERKP